jgi:phosphopantetheinyl transferase (holo-ACP synthase)
MSVEEFSNYLARLCGRAVEPGSVLVLSSAQQARAAGWLAQHGRRVADLRSLLGRPFKPADLFENATSHAAQPAAAPQPLSGPAGGVPNWVRVGIDIQLIAEVIPEDSLADPKSSPELAAIFTLREISFAQTRPHPKDTLAGLFAAKEALRKCSASLMQRQLTELEVLPDAEGRPEFPGYSLSIAHSGGFAIAVAVAVANGVAPGSAFAGGG